MTPNNFERSLRLYQKRTPFRPFTVEMVSGERFQGDHPEALARRGGVAVFVAADGTPTLFDHEGVCRILGKASSRPS